MSLMSRILKPTVPGVATPANPPAQGIPGHPIPAVPATPPAQGIPGHPVPAAVANPPMTVFTTDPLKPVQVSAGAVGLGQIVYLAVDRNTSRYARCVSRDDKHVMFQLDNGAMIRKKDTVPVLPAPELLAGCWPSAATGREEPTPPPMPEPAKIPTAPEPVKGIQIFVDCVPSDPNRKYLDAYIEGIVAGMRSTFNVPDIRLGLHGSPLSYGGWKGVLAAAVRTQPPPAGSYVLFTRDSEISAVVAEALTPLASLVVRGI